MRLTILYFASLREKLGTASEQIELPADVANVGALRAHLAARGAHWQILTQSKSLRAAVNQQMATTETKIADGNEVAFFPPVTGG